MVEIDAEHMLGRMIELAEGAHELREREIAETGLGLRARHPLVDDDGIVARQEADELHDLADRLLRLVARPGVTSATAMAPALMKGLRGLPCSRSSWTMELNAVPDGSRPTRFHKPVADHAERERQREHLGDALDGEGGIGLAGHVLPVRPPS